MGLLIGAMGVALRLTPVGALLEDSSLRWLFAARGPIPPPPAVVVVTIDKTSAEQLGLDARQWPPSRRVYDDLIRSLSRRRVSAIVMDVFFREGRPGSEDPGLADAMTTSGKVALVEKVERMTLPHGEIIDTIRSPTEPFRSAVLALARRRPGTFLLGIFQHRGRPSADITSRGSASLRAAPLRPLRVVASPSRGSESERPPTTRRVRLRHSEGHGSVSA